MSKNKIKTAEEALKITMESGGRIEEFVTKALEKIQDHAEMGEFETWVEIPGGISPGDQVGERMNNKFKASLSERGFKVHNQSSGSVLVSWR